MCRFHHLFRCFSHQPISLWLMAVSCPFTVVVCLLLTKGDLNASQLKNYKSVSNLSFLFKLLECTVQVRLQDFLDNRAPIDQPFSRESSASLNLVSDRAAHPVYNHSCSWWPCMPPTQTDAVSNESAPGYQLK